MNPPLASLCVQMAEYHGGGRLESRDPANAWGVSGEPRVTFALAVIFGCRYKDGIRLRVRKRIAFLYTST